jgi:hypothetical protein
MKEKIMATPREETMVVNEKTWLAWVEKGRLSDLAVNRKIKVAAAIAFALAAFGGAFYLLPR